MRNRTPLALFSSLALIFALASPAIAQANTNAAKEWTLLVYLNGNNNLDSFGAMNINQMEKIGSTANVNVVVEWASMAAGKTVRLLIQKDNDTTKVTSPVVQDLGKVDMGDWRSLVEFVQWGAANYPAKHYMIDVWDHGSGWHAIQAMDTHRVGGIHATDVSWDDNTGHSISTVQLGQAMAESAKAIGHKVDIYASDACLMGMAEVANEMSDSVAYYAGSQDLEPGAGWPYDTFMDAWSKKPTASPREVASMLVDQYVKSYSNGSNGSQEVTFSAFDLSKMDMLDSAVANLGETIAKLGAADQKKISDIIPSTQRFYYDDYVDLSDFVSNLSSSKVDGIGLKVLVDLKQALGQFVVANGDTQSFAKSGGVSIWMPSSSYTYSSYADQYGTLKFSQATKWGNAASILATNSLE